MSFLSQILPNTGLTPEDIKIHLQPDNSIRDVYLAANIDSGKEIVNRLRELFNQ